MTSRVVITAGFLAILLAGVFIEVLARRGRAGLVSSHDVLRWLHRRRFGRVGSFVMWFWLGWHFLAR